MKILTGIYCGIMCLIFPLYYQNNYIDILDAKTRFFVVATCIYILVGLIFSGYLVYKKEYYPDYLWKENKRKVCVLPLIAAAVVSMCFDSQWKSGFWGYDGKLFGVAVVLLCCVMYFFVSEWFQWNPLIYRCMLVGMGIVFFLAIFNRYVSDVFGMYENLVANQQDEFLSTIGQINVLSGVICIFLPFFMGVFLFAKKLNVKILSAVAVWLGFMAGVCTNSDSFFLAMALAAVCFLWFALETKENLLAYLGLGFLGSLSMLALNYLNQKMEFQVAWRKTQKIMLYQIPWIGVAVIFLAAIFILFQYKKEFKLPVIRKAIVMLIFGAMAAAILWMIYKNSGQMRWFVFDDSWGTNRGYVWKRTVELYGQLPFHEKLFGVGLGRFSKFFSIYHEESVSLFGYYFKDAHNEFLQYLVTTGLVGAAGYFGMIFTAMKRCLKEKTKLHQVLFVVLLSGIAQGLVNNPLVFTTPYMFLFAGIAMAKTDEKSESLFE